MIHTETEPLIYSYALSHSIRQWGYGEIRFRSYEQAVMGIRQKMDEEGYRPVDLPTHGVRFSKWVETGEFWEDGEPKVILEECAEDEAELVMLWIEVRAEKMNVV